MYCRAKIVSFHENACTHKRNNSSSRMWRKNRSCFYLLYAGLSLWMRLQSLDQISSIAVINNYLACLG